MVHVIFDLTQPKLVQWESAKQWLVTHQARFIGEIKTTNPDPYTWLKYIRILDACEFNPDPENLSVTWEKIGEHVLRIKKDPNKAASRAWQDHVQAQKLLTDFPY